VLIRAVGLAIIVFGLILVGISGDNHRVPNGRHITYGASLMGLGAIVALFAGELELLIGWARP